MRIPSYQPIGYAEVHPHEGAENLYYILRGRGIVELDGERVLLEPHTRVFIPPVVKHGIYNTGLEDLVIVVVCPSTTCPGGPMAVPNRCLRCGASGPVGETGQELDGGKAFAMASNSSGE